VNAEIVPFDFEGQPIRTVTIDGDPWFVASDVARILGYREASVMCRRIDGDDKSTHKVPPLSDMSTFGGVQDATIISEPGLYVAILGSQVAGAKRFKRWVTHEMLPQVRRTGSYVRQPTLPEALREWASAIEAKEAAEARALQIAAQLRVAAPKVDAFDTLVNVRGDQLVGDVAKELARHPVIARRKIGRDDLFDILEAWGWVYRHGPAKRGRRGKWRAYQSAVETGRLREKATYYTDPVTRELVHGAPQVRVTLKGAADIEARLLAEAGQPTIEGA
jgi:prophage antirepressor-like protein